MTLHPAPRVLPPLAVLVLAFSLGGCGVLGIASKGDIEQTQRDIDVINRTLTAKSQRIDDEINEIGRDLDALQTRLAAAENDIDGLENITAQVAGIADRLATTRQELVILDGRLTRDLSSTAAKAQEAHEYAQLADARGQQITESYLENLRLEKKRLLQQLDQIEELLADWNRLRSDTPVAVTPRIRDESPPKGSIETQRR